MRAKGEDTIAAQATPLGRGGVGIVRISGPMSREIAEAMLGHCPKPRFAEYIAFYDKSGQVIDVGLALFFSRPNSFTGEDVLELQGHGGPVVMDMLLQTAISHGARLARPGEFSERAFLNDKLDLAQAEAIADLIDAGSEQAARSAIRSLQGEFSRAIHRLVEQVTELRVYVEASMDFPEEEIDFLSEGHVAERIANLQQQVERVLEQAMQGSLLKEGINVVLAGRPNAGKSSLLNALARREAAIVTDIPGTTRDIVREEIHIDGMPLHILDTAGLRESGDVVEKEGMRRTWQAIEQADVLLLLVDDTQGMGDIENEILGRLPKKLNIIIIHNKIDLSGLKPGVITKQPYKLALSASNAQGIEDLVKVIKELAGMQTSGEGSFMARQRHLGSIKQAQVFIENARLQAESGQGELVAEELKQAQEALGAITGEVSSDDLLGKIFSEFCIGK